MAINAEYYRKKTIRNAIRSININLINLFFYFLWGGFSALIAIRATDSIADSLANALAKIPFDFLSTETVDSIFKANIADSSAFQIALIVIVCLVIIVGVISLTLSLLIKIQKAIWVKKNIPEIYKKFKSTRKKDPYKVANS